MKQPNQDTPAGRFSFDTILPLDARRELIGRHQPSDRSALKLTGAILLSALILASVITHSAQSIQAQHRAPVARPAPVVQPASTPIPEPTPYTDWPSYIRAHPPRAELVSLPPRQGVAARVINITDGDTIRVLTSDNQLLRIRLRNIDAPEMDQSYGPEAMQTLSRAILGRDVVLQISGLDRYGRSLATIILDGADVNLRMVSDGYAWIYGQYIGSEPLAVQTQYRQAQTLARAQRRGLWADSSPEPPWAWRHRQSKNY